jgi:hypothetical protein
MLRTVLVTGLLLLPCSALAQPYVDLTPFVGYRWGGTIDEPNALGTELSVAESGSYGLILGLAFSPSFALELSIGRQQSDLAASSGLFEPETRVGGVDLTYYQIGGTFEWGRDVRPFFGAGLGAATIDPDLSGTTSETRFAGTFTGGVKIRLNQRLGLRVDGKLLYVALNDSESCSTCYYDDYYADLLVQGEVALGLIVYF